MGRWELRSSFEKAEPFAGCCCGPAPTRFQQTQVKPLETIMGIVELGGARRGMWATTNEP